MPVNPAQLARMRRRAQKGGLAAASPFFNPPRGLWIGGVDYTPYIIANSASIRSTVAPYSGVFRCLLDVPSAAVAGVKVEKELTWSFDGVQYAGRVRSVIPMDQVIASANTSLLVECQDFTTLLDADVCGLALSAPQVGPSRAVVESDAQRIGWLLQSFGHQAVTAHHVMQSYATVPATDYTGMTLRKAIESVLAYSGASYYVDFAKDLHCFIDEKQYAPFTLAEAPDNVSSFAYSGFNLPSDSVDLRNAIYGIPGSPPAGVDTIIEQIATSAIINVAGAAIAGFRRASSSVFPALVSAGSFANSAGPGITPTYGQPTTAGNLVVCTFRGNSNAGLTCSDPTWTQAADSGATVRASIWYKANCGANEAAPTFTLSGGAQLGAQLSEWAGLLPVAPLDQVFAGGSVAVTDHLSISTSKPDQAGDLVIVIFSYELNASVPASFTATLNGNARALAHLGVLSPAASASHASAWGGLGLGPTWYTDEASIALYGRKETAFTDTTVMTQADLDAKGIAALLQNSQPRQEGTFRCRCVGLAVGQRITVQSSLYSVPVIIDPLGNYSGVVQSVEVTYPEDEAGALFAIDFMKPTMTLAVQLGDIVASIPAPAAAAAQVGTLQYIETAVDQLGIGTSFVDLANLSAGVTTGTGRRIKISSYVRVAQNTSASIPTLQVMEGTTVLGADVTNIIAGGQDVLEAIVLLQPTAGAHTYKLQLKTNAGTVDAINSQTKGWIHVEDVGT